MITVYRCLVDLNIEFTKLDISTIGKLCAENYRENFSTEIPFVRQKEGDHKNKIKVKGYPEDYRFEIERIISSFYADKIFKENKKELEKQALETMIHGQSKRLVSIDKKKRVRIKKVK